MAFIPEINDLPFWTGQWKSHFGHCLCGTKHHYWVDTRHTTLWLKMKILNVDTYHHIFWKIFVIYTAYFVATCNYFHQVWNQSVPVSSQACSPLHVAWLGCTASNERCSPEPGAWMQDVKYPLELNHTASTYCLQSTPPHWRPEEFFNDWIRSVRVTRPGWGTPAPQLLWIST